MPGKDSDLHSRKERKVIGKQNVRGRVNCLFTGSRNENCFDAGILQRGSGFLICDSAEGDDNFVAVGD